MNAAGSPPVVTAKLGLDLDDQCTEHVDPEALARLAILGIAAHRRRDVVVDPVPRALIVIIGTTTTDDERPDVLDLRQSHNRHVQRSSSPAPHRRRVAHTIERCPRPARPASFNPATQHIHVSSDDLHHLIL